MVQQQMHLQFMARIKGTGSLEIDIAFAIFLAAEVETY
jgi:hypothetical protein